MFNANEVNNTLKINNSGVEEKHSLPLRLGDHPRSGVAKVK